MEEWRDVKDYEGIYQISNLGSLKSNKDYKKASINQDGYYQTVLYKNGKKKNVLVHRLVADSFLPNTDNKPTVNHKDGNKLNNKLENLEWSTHKEQTQHSINVLGHKSILTKQCREKQILNHKRKVRRSDGVEFNSIKDASMGDEVLRRKISSVCKGYRKHAGGYSWKYI